MAIDLRYTFVGWCMSIGKTHNITERMKKREIILKRIKKSSAKGRKVWRVNLSKFIAYNDSVDLLSGVLPGQEVFIRFSIRGRYYMKNGVMQLKDGIPIVFSELEVIDAFVVDGSRRPKEEDIYKINDWEEIKNEENESSDPLLEVEKKKNFPDDKVYNYDSFDRNKDYSKSSSEDGLPF